MHLARLADLTDAAVQAKYGVDHSVLTGVDLAPCQRLAERLRSDGFEGAWTHSRADQPDGRQLVVFLDTLLPGSTVRVAGITNAHEALAGE